MANKREENLLAGQAPQRVVVGLGHSGLSCVKFLLTQGEQPIVLDSRQTPPLLSELQQLDNECEVYLGVIDPAVLDGVDELVVSPGVPLSEPIVVAALERGISVVGDIELFARFAKAPVVAITGSNGKSTVTTLFGEMVAASGRRVEVGGNIGIPALELLSRPVPDFYVLELSSFQLETTHTLNVAAGVVLNISEDHMDRHGTVENYAAIKQKIYQGNGVMVLNRDDEMVAAMASSERSRIYFQSSQPEEDEYGMVEEGDDLWLVRGKEKLLAASAMKVAGSHNHSNALAALALGEAIGLERDAMITALKIFKGLDHRCQLVAEFECVRWFNDSKGTNVGATAAAISGLPGKSVVILGGEGKGADFSPLTALMGAKASAAVLIGRDAGLIEKVMPAGLPVVRAESMEDAVAEAYLLAKEGESVLLSPACASFDMFSGYEERGNVFVSAVEQLIS